MGLALGETDASCYIASFSQDTMLSTTLYLVRHAQSENNAKPDAERIPDPGITPIGVEQSNCLASMFLRYQPHLLYCSPFLRSLQTAAPIAKTTGLTPIVRQDLFEQGGCYSGHEAIGKKAEPGRNREAIETLYPHWILDERINGTGWNSLDRYETICMARERARTVRIWFESQQDLHHQRRVAMVIHADLKLRLLEAFLEVDDFNPHIEDPANTSVTCLVQSGDRWKLLFYNQFLHLPDELVTY